MNFALLISLFIIIGKIVCDDKRYENYTLFRGVPIEDKHLKFLQNLSDVYDVNYWRMSGALRMPVDFVISPNDKESFLKKANENGVFLATIMENIQNAFDKQTVKSYTRKQMETFDWYNFYRTKDIYGWMQDLARAFPQEVTLFSIGKTHEDRDILAVKVVLLESSIRSKVIIEGGIHAREWISPAFVTYMLHQIVYSSVTPDSALRQIALMYEWYFVPVLNPDGYEYTIDHDRQWRKNRHGSGVDLNRNFGYGFGTEGVSFEKKSETYCGEKAFSEKESSAMAKFIESKSQNLKFYISFHSYGQYIIIPYAHSKKHLDNYAEVKDMGLRAADKIQSYYNRKYKVGTAYDTVAYLVSGASTCWAKKSFNIPYTLTFELRDLGSYGFAIPPVQIIPTCEETLAGVVSLLTPRNKAFQDEKLYVEAQNEGQTRTYLNQVLMIFYVVMLMVFTLKRDSD